MTEFVSKKSKKIAATFAIVIMLLSYSPWSARKAEALFVDWPNLIQNTISAIGTHSIMIKEYVLDTVAYSVINLMIEKMAASTVNWINSGFKGSPAFVTDPESYFKDIGDKVAGDLIFKNPNLNFLCGPLSARIKIALSRAYLGEKNFQCKLTDVAGNVDDFLGDFERGGWDKFFIISQDRTQNPIAIYIEAEGQLAQKIAQKTSLKDKELAWGKGFLSYKSCIQYDNASVGQEVDNSNMTNTIYDSEGNAVDTGVPNQKLPDSPPKCIKETTSTPGDVINNKLNSVLKIGDGKIEAADELNEIISALLNQLANQIVGGIGRGLRGLSRPNSSNNNQTFTSQLSNPTKDSQISQYFDTSAATTNEVLNQPTPDFNKCRTNPNDPECLPPPGAQPDSVIISPGTTPNPCIQNPNGPECTSNPSNI